MTPSPVELLESGRHSLAIVNNGNTYVFDGRGVADLFSIYKETPGVLFGASLADKVVGKGAAALMVVRFSSADLQFSILKWSSQDRF